MYQIISNRALISEIRFQIKKKITNIKYYDYFMNVFGKIVAILGDQGEIYQDH